MPFQTITGLSSAALIGQLIMPRLDVQAFSDDSEYARRTEQLVRETRAGGFCIFGGTTELVARATRKLQAIAIASDVTPLLFSCDCEFGLPMRLTEGGTEFPDAMAIAKTGEPKLALAAGKAIAREMRAIGLGWNFAPVADVNSNPANPIINTRAFGDDPETAAVFAVEFMRGLQSEGVAATGKHFPGHGDTSVDSHIELPFIDKDWDEFNALELPPFKALIEAGVYSIMSGHLAAPNLAQYLSAGDSERNIPATLSHALTTTLLRERLGFEGIVVTDALEMHAITHHFGSEEAAVRALQAGADVLLMPLDALRTGTAIESAVDSGKLDLEMIRERVARILRLKAKTIIESSSIDAGQLAECASKHSMLADEIARKAIEVTGSIALTQANILILADDRSAALEKANAFAESMRDAIATIDILTPNDWPERSVELDPNTILATFHHTRGYLGTNRAALTIPALVREIAASLAGRGIALRGLILFGSPYLDIEFQTPPGFVLKTFSESRASIRAAAQTLRS
ncbi:MAG TPA: glycoside hydrolase family 3 N-terminal domain-containing protein [Candidatus Kapabacteria bacterium]|nr:glycoside hydrolase family 3 N-terminal domain-containing protein [Candidatus Kapabacteria bacterium]